MLSFDLSDKHALVCGASTGIGKASALALAQAGAHTTLVARTESKLAEVAETIADAGGSAAVVVADLDDRDGFVQVIDDVLDAVGPVHIVLNNTGGPPGGPLVDAEPQAIAAALSRHVLSTHALMQRVLPGMTEAGYGRFIQVLSTSVREPIDNLGVSNLTRAAVASWAKTLSRELPPGVTINNILPGFTDTDRLSSLATAAGQRTGRSADQVREAWKGMVPEGRLGRPEELASAIAFLASPAASYVRGVSLPVDGGRLRSI